MPKAIKIEPLIIETWLTPHFHQKMQVSVSVSYRLDKGPKNDQFLLKMAKISPTSIKYSIIADFVADGPFQKPDVIGALFGQTEGLLGSDMELRELQKEGKIGRIEVELVTEGGKTTGEINIPSALDKTETTIIAAALETIDKIGPTDAKITIKSIEDFLFITILRVQQYIINNSSENIYEMIIIKNKFRYQFY